TVLVWARVVGSARTPWAAVVDSAAADSQWLGTAALVRSPSMVAALVRSPSMAAAFTAHASTAVFAALPSPAAPPTPTATIAAGSGTPAATATCEFGSVDRRSRADEIHRSLWGVRHCRVPHRAGRTRSAARQIPRTG